MFGFTMGLISGQDRGWSSVPALAGFGIGICGIAAFVVVESAQPHPMLDLSLFRLPRFVGAVLAMFAYASCAQVMASLLPQFLQNGLGRSPLEAGFAMLPFALAMLVFPYVGRWLGRVITSDGLLVLGLCVVAVGNALTSLGAYLGAAALVAAGMLVLGAGGGLLNGETQKAIMSAIPRDRAGMASGISTTSRFSGILLGFAFLSGVLSTVTHVNLARVAYGPMNGFADAVASGNLQSALNGLTATARALAITEAHLAYSAGFSAALAAAAFGAALGALIVHRLTGKRG
jgi:Na+/melibiose symporter-like transporter